MGILFVAVDLKFLKYEIAERVKEKLMVQRSQPITVL